MPVTKNSAALEQIFAHAKTISGGGSLTAEQFLVAVCDYVDGVFDAGGNRDQLRAMLSNAGVQTAQLKASLMPLVTDGAKSYSATIYIQQKIFQARQAAEQQNATELTPEMLLAMVLQDPSDAIRKTMTSGNNAFAAAPTPTTSVPPTPTPVQSPTPVPPPAPAPAPAQSGRTGGIDLDALLGRTPSQPPVPEEPQLPPREAISALVEKTRTLRQTLLDQIYGQDYAVGVFATGYFRAEMLRLTDKNRTRPATFLLAGPPGVGKTFLAERAAAALGLPFQRFDMSEYADKEANMEFCGSDKVYKGAQPGNVTDFVAKNPRCLLLFDEVEKAHLVVIHLFLQMLDAGRLRDNYTDEEVSFKDAIIIFTTNAGKQLYEESDSGDFSGLSRKVILAALQKDYNPYTGAPFFPAAICSRFASGNVVMLNHISAHDLRAIARREVLRHASNFENELGIKVTIDESVHTALLFAEGGAADARMIRSRAESFFDDELFELFRLATAPQTGDPIGQLQNINITLQLPNDPAISALFTPSETPQVLVFAGEEMTAACTQAAGDACQILPVRAVPEAMSLLHDHDIKMVLLDPTFGQTADAPQYLDTEDVSSVARDFFHTLRESYRDMPVYLLQTPQRTLSVEEKMSFTRLGVRSVITLESTEQMAQRLAELCSNIHQQQSMNYLARANKVVSFQTAQSLSADGQTAQITLFDFAITTAVDAEDSKNILSNVSRPNVRFDEVIGAEDAKAELKYFVDYLKNPKKFMGTGVRPPKGVILYGPPGTGKTMMAKAMACESGVTFITAEGNQFLQKYVGEGKDLVHQLFRTARKYAPSILFVDEIDAIAKERVGGDHSYASGEDVLTAFLAEMDGFKNDPSKPVFVLAATNFDVTPGSPKSLDAALMRRFDRRVYVDLPNKEERIRYLNMKLAANPAFQVSSQMVENLAVRSTGSSLAELELVVEMALRSAIRSGDLKVTDAMLEEAFEIHTSGEERKWNPDTLLRTARHEAGHTFLCWHSGENPTYVTIVARGNHGGYMQHGDQEDKPIYTKEDLLARIRTSLGGRAAELVYYGETDGISTGPSGDLETATAVARSLICTYGMDSQFGLAVIDAQAARMGEVSDQVRAAVNQILDDQLQTAISLIREGQAAIDALVDALMTKNHLTGDEINTVLSAHFTRP